MSSKYCILAALCIFLCYRHIEANTDTCRVAGLCGVGGSFKQLTFNFSSVGGLPVVQGPPGNDGFDAEITEEMLNDIKDSVVQEMNFSMSSLQDSVDDLITNMQNLELMILAIENQNSNQTNQTIAPAILSSNATSELLTQIRFIELALQLHARTVAALEQKVGNVEAVLGGQNQMLAKLNDDLRKLKYSSECSGLSVGGTCYFIIHQKIDHPSAEAECSKDHATLASINSKELYDALYNNYIIDEVIMADKSAVFLWLGSSLSNETNEVIHNNGEMSNFTHWLPGWPRNQNNFDRITWLVMRDPNMTYHGMLNSHPMTVSYPLCQKNVQQEVSGHCPELLSPANGSIQYVGSNDHTGVNSVAVVVCNAGFVMADDEVYVLICTESGQWSSPLPSCHPGESDGSGDDSTNS